LTSRKEKSMEARDLIKDLDPQGGIPDSSSSSEVDVPEEPDVESGEALV
jgi:hypothetical protein